MLCACQTVAFQNKYSTTWACQAGQRCAQGEPEAVCNQPFKPLVVTHWIARHGDLARRKQSPSMSKHSISKLTASSGANHGTAFQQRRCLSDHATAAPASAVPRLGFLPINGHSNDNWCVVSTAQYILVPQWTQSTSILASTQFTQTQYNCHIQILCTDISKMKRRKISAHQSGSQIFNDGNFVTWIHTKNSKKWPHSKCKRNNSDLKALSTVNSRLWSQWPRSLLTVRYLP